MQVEPSTYKMDIMTNWSLSKEHQVGLTIKKLLQLNKKNGQTDYLVFVLSEWMKKLYN